MKYACYAAALAFALNTFGSFATHAEGGHVEPIKQYVEFGVKPWLTDPVVVDAIKAQNAKNASISQADIDSMDQKWRAEKKAGDHPMIDAVLANALSQFLRQKQEESGGLISEAFVMDNHGLNVGQSAVTSDYWQGDEDKWQKTYSVGKDAVFVDAVEMDESSQTLQSQASLAISDPATGEVIGAITVGINVDAL